jgi:hypothetical protein
VDNVQDLIFAAWEKVWPTICDRPEEIAKRIGRRRQAVLARPPRAWCLAVRASDRRIASGCREPVEHKVTLDAAMLRRLCAPVELTAPGETLSEVSARLGTRPEGLITGRLNGVFRGHHIPTARGRPQPLLMNNVKLDPGARGWRGASPLWSWTTNRAFVKVPAELCATLTRVPRFGSHVSRHRYDENRHPEVDASPAGGKSRKLPPPEPDYVWYKWSCSEHYLGDDWTNWRKSFDDDGERPPKWRKKRSRKGKYKSVAKGSLMFKGFSWLCPSCGKTCGTLYYPLPPVNLLADRQPRIAQIVDVVRKCKGFACARCHGVQYFSAIHHGCWNKLVGYLSGGLLYGHEVSKPEWFVPQRKNKFVPHLNAAPSRRRPQVMEMLLKGMTYKQIGAELGIAPATVARHAVMLYAQHGVRGREALARKLRRAMPAAWVRKKVAINPNVRDMRNAVVPGAA